jgi:hypothetical protein
MSHVVYDKFPTPSDFANNIPEDLNSLCLRMLAKSIDGRMKDLKEFIGIISQYLLGRGRLTSTLRTSPSTSSLLQAFASKKEGVASVDSQPELTRLEIENQMLRAENLRSQKKIEILMQIAQLGVFSKSREKELWSRLAEI